jgi:hypothetical protein
MEDFVNIELAIKLKELGFNIPFFFYYRTDDKKLYHLVRSQPLVYGKDTIDDEVVIAPTIAQVLKWLREEKHLEANGCYDNDEEGWMGYVCEMDVPDLYAFHALKERHKLYEEAALSAIEYILNNNLI